MTAACYRIVLTPDVPSRILSQFSVWMNLATLEKFASRPGSTTNELRTSVTLVLSRSFDEARAQF